MARAVDFDKIIDKLLQENYIERTQSLNNNREALCHN